MDASCLNHLMSDAQRKAFEADGYLILPGVLGQANVVRLTAVVDRVWDESVKKGHDPKTHLFVNDFVGRDAAFLDLVDYPKTFPLVWAMLGPYIQLYISHLSVAPQEAPESEAMKLPLNFHQDSGRVNQELEYHPRPRLSMKVGFWLTDCSVPGRGNFYVVPGSHVKDSIPLPEAGLPDGAVPVLASPGDAVLFDRRIWHDRSPNHSGVVRKVLFYGYSYRWVRTNGTMQIPDDLWAQCDPVRRQLLESEMSGRGFYLPRKDDVPLRLWLEAHLGPEAAATVPRPV